MRIRCTRRSGACAGARWLAPLVCALLLPAPLAAQTYRGTIRGSVSDSSGAVVPGATVTATSLGTGQSRTARAAEDGGYVIPELPAGEYEVAATATGFGKLVERVVVSVGSDTRLDLEIKPGIEDEAVDVTPDEPVVNADRAVLSTVVTTREIAQLPLNGRDFTKLVPLAPGATVEPSGVAGSEKGFGQFNINGNRDRSNNYTLDGTDNNDPFFNNSALNQVGITGAPASLLPIDAIQEFNLQSHFGAEYGRNSGSVVNVLTKSGTNQFHGTLFEYVRNDVFDARNFFNTEPNPQTAFRNNNFGGSLGGPVVEGRTFFFLAYEGQRERVGSTFNLQLPTIAQRDAARALALANGLTSIERVLDSFPSTATGALSYSVRNKNDLDAFIAKVDHSFGDTRSLTGRYAFSQGEQIFPLGSLGGFGSGSRLGQYAQVSPTRVQVVSLSFLSSPSPATVNEIRVGFSRYRTAFSSSDADFDPASIGLDLGTGEGGLPEFDFAGIVENLGATAFSIPRGRVSQTYQILDNLTWLNGKHLWKLGGEYRRASVNAFNDNLARGLFSFFSIGLAEDPVVDILASFYLGHAFVLANAGDTRRTTFNNGASFFAQDDVRVTPNVTLNLGLRWEYFGPLGEERDRLSNLNAQGELVLVNTGGLEGAWERDLNNFSPRVGVAWDVSGEGKTIVRAGYGLYYDYVPQNLLIANFTTSAGIATNPIGPSPVFGLRYVRRRFNGSEAGPALVPASGPPSIFVTDGKLITPYTQSWNLNLQRELASGVGAEVGYVGSKGTHLVRLYDRNQPDASGAVPDPRYGVVDVLSTGANGTYHALQARLRTRGWRGLSGLTSFTWSKSLDDASDGIDFNFASAAFPQDSTNLRAEHGPSTFDTRVRFSSAFSYAAPGVERFPSWIGEGWTLNTILVAQTGRPIPIVTSNDTSGRFNFHQRPDLVPGVDPILDDWGPESGYLNPFAFRQPADGTFGDLGRNAIYGPGYWNVDFSVTKLTRLTERVSLELRAEAFNVFNHPNFALPSGTIVPAYRATGSVRTFVPPAGIITQTPDVAQGNPGLGGGGPRVIQFGARLVF
jgi:hypothetical protein